MSIGFAARGPHAPRDYNVPRNWAVIVVGLLSLGMFAIVLGPSGKP